MTEENTDNKIDLDLKNPQLYEVGYLVAPTVAVENVATEAGDISATIEKMGGIITDSGMPQTKQLAYTISKTVEHKQTKYDSAYFGWVKFEIEPDKAGEIKKYLEEKENLLRFILIKTTKVIRQVAPRKRMPIKQKKVDQIEKTERPKVTKEELDKQIDELIASTES